MLQKHFGSCSLLCSYFWEVKQHTSFPPFFGQCCVTSQDMAAAKVRTDEALSNYKNFVGVCGQMILWYASPSNLSCNTIHLISVSQNTPQCGKDLKMHNEKIEPDRLQCEWLKNKHLLTLLLTQVAKTTVGRDSDEN